MPFDLRYPPTVLFGCGRRRELPELLRQAAPTGAPPRVVLVGTRALLQTDESRREWDELCAGGLCDRFLGVPHDPPLVTVAALVERLRQARAEVVVAAGGGSAMDAAKAAAVLAPATGAVSAFFHGELALSRPGLPLFLLPTTAGSGAELTQNAVLTDPEAGVKRSLRSPFMVARGVIVDPELTLGMPPAVTAATGIDALTQAIESYVSLRATAPSRALAREAVRILTRSLAGAYRDGANLIVRTAVAEGSLLSAMAFSQSGLGAVHGLAHPLGLLLGLPHGYTCGVLLPHVLEWNAPACQTELRELAQTIGLETPTQFVDAVRTLCVMLGVPRSFGSHGLRQAAFDRIIATCRSPSMKANPRPLTDVDIRALLLRLADANASTR